MTTTQEPPGATTIGSPLDPTAYVPVVDVASYGFEGRFEDWSGEARYFEYSQAADPIRSGHTSPVPLRQFSPSLYESGPSRIIELDVSRELGLSVGPATSPGLLANFIRINAGDRISTEPNATSELYYVVRGHGYSAVNGSLIDWEQGDFLTLPAGSKSGHYAEGDAVLYWVTDAPLLRFLGVTASEPRFVATKFPRARSIAELGDAANAPDAQNKSRVSVLLANSNQEQTLTITHVLWAMFGLLPPGAHQKAHRHQSVALDLILDCPPGCYSLVGKSTDDRGNIIDPIRVDWEPGGAFITPPGLWHAHVNESDRAAHLIPIQDAGLQTYLRSLDIRFH